MDEKTEKSPFEASADLESVKAQVMAKRAETEQVYTFQNAWGGISHGNKPPLIHEKMLALRLATGALEAKRTPGADGRAPQFPVKSAKELMQKHSQAMVDLDLLCIPLEMTPMPIADVMFTGKNGPQPGTGTYLLEKLRYIAPDGSYYEGMGFGGGLDRDDKAGGKASTYAYKDGVLKILGIPEKELVDTDDEAGQGEDRTKKAPRNEKAAKQKAAPVPRQDETPVSTNPTGPVEPNAYAGWTAEQFVAGIEASKDKDELLKVASAAKKALDEAGQKLAGAAYRATKTRLGV